MNTTVIPNQSGSNYNLSLGDQDTGQVGSPLGNQQISDLNLEKFYDEVRKFTRQYDTSGQIGEDDPLVDQRGAPRLDAPTETFSANDMVDLLRSLRSKTEDGQLRTAKEALESARIKAEKNTDQQLEKIQEWIEKCKEAESKGTAAKVFGWIGKVFAFVAAIATVVAAAVATVATGGTAAPLLALAVVGAISATLMLASAISQECGGPEISINSLIQHTVGKFLTDVCGVDPEQASNICKILGGVVSIACPVLLAIEPSLLGNMAESIAVMAGVDPQVAGYIGMALSIVAAVGVGIAMAVMTGGSSAAMSATQVTSKVLVSSLKTFNTIMTSASAIVSGSTQIAQGGLNISKGHSEKEAEDAISAKKELEAMMVKLQRQMEENREEIQKIIQQIEESTQTVSKMIAGTTDSLKQVAMNMGSKPTV